MELILLDKKPNNNLSIQSDKNKTPRIKQGCLIFVVNMNFGLLDDLVLEFFIIFFSFFFFFIYFDNLIYNTVWGEKWTILATVHRDSKIVGLSRH